MDADSEAEGIVGRTQLTLGAVYGVAAYVVGLAVTYVLLQLDDEVDFTESAEISTDIRDIDVVGWTFYNAHFVDWEVTGTAGGETQTESGNLLSDASLQFPEFLYYLVPIVALVGAGYLLVSKTSQADFEADEAAKNGAVVVAGYLPLAALGSFYFTVDTTEETLFGEISMSVGPETTMAILLAGIAFPVVFGAIGGYLANERGDS